jgi:hypothetical protein
MNPSVLFASALMLFFPAPQSNSPISHDTYSNTFVTASETVLDNALAADIAADDEHFEPEMKQLKTSRDNLKNMASNTQEDEIVTDSDNLIFLISSCHIQARDPGRVAPCQAQISTSLNRLMTKLNRHKSNGVWLEGPPSRI